MNKKQTENIKTFVLLFTAAFFALTGTTHPFITDSAKELAGYLALILLVASVVIIGDRIRNAWKGNNQNGGR